MKIVRQKTLLEKKIKLWKNHTLAKIFFILGNKNIVDKTKFLPLVTKFTEEKKTFISTLPFQLLPCNSWKNASANRQRIFAEQK